MSPMQVHEHRLMAERYCVTPCTLYRGGVLLSPQPRMRDGSPLRCRIKDDGRSRIPGADATQTMMRWLITLPNDVDVREQDHLRTSNREYVLAPIANPDSDSPRNKCYAYALWPLDAMGTPGSPLYLRPNCVVSVSRLDGTSGPQNLDAELKTPNQRFTPQGGEQETYLLFAPTLIGQIHNSDSITISKYGDYSVNLGPFEVNYPRPTGDGGMVTLKVGITGFTL